MSIHSEIITATASVAGGRVYPDIAPQTATLPLIVYKRAALEPAMTLFEYAGLTKSVFVFECWAASKDAALSLASSLRSAIESSSIATKTREPADAAQEFEPEVDQFVELVAYSFWHS